MLDRREEAAATAEEDEAAAEDAEADAACALADGGRERREVAVACRGGTPVDDDEPVDARPATADACATAEGRSWGDDVAGVSVTGCTATAFFSAVAVEAEEDDGPSAVGDGFASDSTTLDDDGGGGGSSVVCVLVVSACAPGVTCIPVACFAADEAVGAESRFVSVAAAASLPEVACVSTTAGEAADDEAAAAAAVSAALTDGFMVA